MRATESAFDKNGKAQKNSGEKAKNLTKQIELQKKKVDELKRGLEQASAKWGEDSAQVSKWRQAVADAETTLNKLNKELNEVKPSVGERLQEAGKSISGFGQKITSVGDTMTKYVSAPILGLGAVSVKTAMDFETSMAKVQTIADTTSVPIGDLRESILDLSSDTGIAATDIAESVYNAISAGQSTADAVGFVETASQLAKAGFTDVGNSIDVLTTILNSYGLEAKEVTGVSDRLITVQNRGKTTIAQLSSSMGKVIPTAAAFGVNLDNVASAYVVLTKNGISTAEATTYFNSMLNELGKSGTKASEIIKKRTGQSFTDLMKSGSNVADVLKILKDEADKSNLSLADMFGSAEAGKAALTILSDGGTEFVNSMDAMQSAAGATTTAFETMADTTATKMQKTLNNIKNTGIEAGGNLLEMLEPGIEAVGKEIEKLSEWYRNLDKETQTSVSKAAVALGVGGPLISAIGKTVDAVGKITTAVGKAISAFSGFGGASVLGPLAATGGAVGLVAGSVAAVAWAMKTSHWKIPNYDQLMSDAETLKGEIESIQTDINNIGQNIDVAIKNVDVNAQPIEYLREELHKCFEENGTLKAGMEETASYIMGELNTAMGTDLSTTFTTNMDANKSKLAEVDQAIDSYISKMKEAAITQAFTSEYANALTAEKEATTAAAEAYDALLDTYTRMSEAEAQLAQDKINYANGVEIDAEANANLRRELVSLTEVFDEQTQNCVEAAGAAAEASGEVNGLETAMEMLASADPAERSKAPEFFANITTNAKQAGKTVRKEADSAFKEISKKASKIADDPWKAKIEVENPDKQMMDIKRRSEKIISNMTGRIVEITGAPTAANAAKVTMTAILAGLTATVGGVAGASTAASTAKSLMQSIFDNPLIARVNEVTGWASAVQSAWSSMQAWFNSNPLVSYVREVVQTVREPGWNWSGIFHANGGFVTKPEISMVGEAGPEVIIPLSQNRRGRAMSLYRQTGAILGAGNGGTVNNSTTNLGGVSINVYASPTQSADEIADVVSKRIAQQVYSRGAVFA